MIFEKNFIKVLLLTVILALLVTAVSCCADSGGETGDGLDTRKEENGDGSSNAETEADLIHIYEKYYIDPKDVLITANGKTKNLIYIYLESMETTYASMDVGGRQPEENYIPNLTALTKEGITFTNKDEGLLGGFRPINNIAWTMASLLGITAGVPFGFPVDNNNMSRYAEFAPNMTVLGDVLEEKGYVQEFLCGSDATFGGRRNYFTQHGNYKIFDLYTARAEGYVAEDYHNGWWGFEDSVLFDIAKDELTRLAEEDQPFNLTMLTVDTHKTSGYLCSECDETLYGTEESGRLKTVLRCSDKMVTEFVEWCKQQDFYKDTVIILTGDHPIMQDTLANSTAYRDRTIYNCILNCDVTLAKGATSNRDFTGVDMFPTTLAAMGFEIEGNRLGLGVNMFSGEATIIELEGYKVVSKEFLNKDKYYEYYKELTGFIE